MGVSDNQCSAAVACTNDLISRRRYNLITIVKPRTVDAKTKGRNPKDFALRADILVKAIGFKRVAREWWSQFTN